MIHGNNIKRLKEVDKLVALTRLKSLSLHGNPTESVSGYRQYIVHSHTTAADCGLQWSD
uniref:Uncharacterized protein n=1 Tax=Amphimedon queenslandica TaxID=400682 RepID=A0A1X7SD79_AMPQE